MRHATLLQLTAADFLCLLGEADTMYQPKGRVKKVPTLPLLLIRWLVKLREHVQCEANATHPKTTQVFTKTPKVDVVRAWKFLKDWSTLVKYMDSQIEKREL